MKRFSLKYKLLFATVIALLVWAVAADLPFTFKAGDVISAKQMNQDLAALDNAKQERVTGTCAAGSSIRIINANGTVTCETDDIGSGSGGAGVSALNGMTGAVTLQAGSNIAIDDSVAGQIKISAVGGGSGGTTYSADNTSLALNGTTFSIKDGGVSTGKIADNAVTGDKLGLPLELDGSSNGPLLAVANSGGGSGVYGQAGDVSGFSLTPDGVWGNSSDSIGVAGTSKNYIGVYGQSTISYGVYGGSSSSYGVYGISSSSEGVRGISKSGYGVYGQSSSQAGVGGRSDSSYGVYGASTNNDGVYGYSKSHDGVHGDSASGVGVRGDSTSSDGVFGVSTSGYGMFGRSSSNDGVHAESGSGTGMAALSTSGIGVYGQSASGIGVQGISLADQPGLYGQSNSGSGIYATSTSGASAYFHGGADGSGNCSYAGGAGWDCTSDKNAKENFQPVDPTQVLDSLVKMPISTWNMKGDTKKTPHLGPVAQDFKAAFGLGDSDTTINTADAQGVALAAIQGLNQKLERENQALKAQMASLETRLAALEARSGTSK